jgi:FkbM family methyltransferase
MNIRQIAHKLIPPALLGRIRTYLLRRRLRHFPVRSVRHRYGDVDLNIEMADPLSVGWYDRDWLPLVEIQLLADTLGRGALVFDLGAHQGVVGLQLAHAVGESGRVICVEANPHNALVAQHNKELNNCSNLEVLQAAVAEVSGPIVFNTNLDGSVEDGSGKHGRIQVDGWSIDDLASRYGLPGVIYLDVEGYELKALHGASAVLSRHPDCFVEVHAGGHLQSFGGSVEELLRFFPASDYDLWMHREGDRGAVRLDPASAPCHERFFLTAIARK